MPALKGQVLLYPQPDMQGAPAGYSAPTDIRMSPPPPPWDPLAVIRSASVGIGMRLLMWPVGQQALTGPQGEAVGGWTVTGAYDVLRGSDPANMADEGRANISAALPVGYYKVTRGVLNPLYQGQQPPVTPPPVKPPPQLGGGANGGLDLTNILLLSSLFQGSGGGRKRRKRKNKRSM